MTVTERWHTEGRKAIVEKITELGIGLTLLSKGWEHVEEFERFPLWVAFIFAAGLFVIAGAVFHERLERRIKNSSGLFHLLEGVVEISCGAILFGKGKHWIPIFLIFLGLVYLSVGLVHLLNKPENRERAERRLRMYQAAAFILFGAATAVLATMKGREPMVYLMDAVLVGSGIFILARKGVRAKRLGLAGRVLDRIDKKKRKTSE